MQKSSHSVISAARSSSEVISVMDIPALAVQARTNNIPMDAQEEGQGPTLAEQSKPSEKSSSFSEDAECSVLDIPAIVLQERNRGLETESFKCQTTTKGKDDNQQLEKEQMLHEYMPAETINDRVSRCRQEDIGDFQKEQPPRRPQEHEVELEVYQDRSPAARTAQHTTTTPGAFRVRGICATEIETSSHISFDDESSSYHESMEENNASSFASVIVGEAVNTYETNNSSWETLPTLEDGRVISLAHGQASSNKDPKAFSDGTSDTISIVEARIIEKNSGNRCGRRLLYSIIALCFLLAGAILGSTIVLKSSREAAIMGTDSNEENIYSDSGESGQHEENGPAVDGGSVNDVGSSIGSEPWYGSETKKPGIVDNLNDPQNPSTTEPPSEAPVYTAVFTMTNLQMVLHGTSLLDESDLSVWTEMTEFFVRDFYEVESQYEVSGFTSRILVSSVVPYESRRKLRGLQNQESVILNYSQLVTCEVQNLNFDAFSLLSQPFRDISDIANYISMLQGSNRPNLQKVTSISGVQLRSEENTLPPTLAPSSTSPTSSPTQSITGSPTTQQPQSITALPTSQQPTISPTSNPTTSPTEDPTDANVTPPPDIVENEENNIENSDEGNPPPPPKHEGHDNNNGPQNPSDDGGGDATSLPPPDGGEKEESNTNSSSPGSPSDNGGGGQSNPPPPDGGEKDDHKSDSNSGGGEQGGGHDGQSSSPPPPGGGGNVSDDDGDGGGRGGIGSGGQNNVQNQEESGTQRNQNQQGSSGNNTGTRGNGEQGNEGNNGRQNDPSSGNGGRADSGGTSSNSNGQNSSTGGQRDSGSNNGGNRNNSGGGGNSGNNERGGGNNNGGGRGGSGGGPRLRH